MACAILERTSGLEPSSETTAPRYLKLVTVPNFCPFTFISLFYVSRGGSSAFGSLVILDVARCCLCLFTLYINIKIGKNSC